MKNKNINEESCQLKVSFPGAVSEELEGLCKKVCLFFFFFVNSLGLGASCARSADILIDLLDVDVQSISQTQQQTPVSSPPPPADLRGLSATGPHLSGHSAPSAARCLLDDEPLSLSNVYF